MWLITVDPHRGGSISLRPSGMSSRFLTNSSTESGREHYLCSTTTPGIPRSLMPPRPLPKRVVNGETPAVHAGQAQMVKGAVRDRQGSAGRPQDLRLTASPTPCPVDSPAG